MSGEPLLAMDSEHSETMCRHGNPPGFRDSGHAMPPVTILSKTSKTNKRFSGDEEEEPFRSFSNR
jgi:hypothetical protein